MDHSEQKPAKEKIAGYRSLSEVEIALINEIKSVGETLERIVSKVWDSHNVDKRWASIGKTDLQTGLMALVRAVAQPTTF